MDVQAEWAEEQRLRAEQARLEQLHWLNCMEFGRALDDETPAVAKHTAEPKAWLELDVPSFLRKAVAVDRHTVSERPAINRQAPPVEVNSIEFTEPDTVFLNDSLAIPINPTPLKISDASEKPLSIQRPNITNQIEELEGDNQANVMPSPSLSLIHI